MPSMDRLISARQVIRIAAHQQPPDDVSEWRNVAITGVPVERHNNVEPLRACLEPALQPQFPQKVTQFERGRAQYARSILRLAGSRLLAGMTLDVALNPVFC